jgi:hypothetical protein
MADKTLQQQKDEREAKRRKAALAKHEAWSKLTDAEKAAAESKLIKALAVTQAKNSAKSKQLKSLNKAASVVAKDKRKKIKPEQVSMKERKKLTVGGWMGTLSKEEEQRRAALAVQYKRKYGNK